jgi:hypothetical protein
MEAGEQNYGIHGQADRMEDQRFASQCGCQELPLDSDDQAIPTAYRPKRASSGASRSARELRARDREAHS